MAKTSPSSPARVAAALAKQEQHEAAQRSAEIESARIREMFDKERAALAKRYGPARLDS
jgi:hypothetical protein